MNFLPGENFGLLLVERSFQAQDLPRSVPYIPCKNS